MSALIMARDLLDRSTNGHEITAQELQDLADRSREEAPGLDPAQGRQLVELFRLIAVRAEQAHQQTRKAISRATSGRRALSGYGHLRPNRRSQHMRKKI